MNSTKRMALAGLVGSFILSLVLIYWVLGDAISSMTGISHSAVIKYGVTLLVLITAIRACLILLEKDAVTNFISKFQK